MIHPAARKLLSRAARADSRRRACCSGQARPFRLAMAGSRGGFRGNKRAEHASGETIPGMDIDETAMLQLWSRLGPLIKASPFPAQKSESTRYYYNNSFFTFFDGQIYFAMIGYFKPKSIVEIGSGFSSAVALDARDHFGIQTKIHFC